MNRTETFLSLSPQETIINTLNAQQTALNAKLAWVTGDEFQETKARLESVERALEFAYQL